LLLLVGPEGVDHVGGDEVSVDHPRDRHPASADLFDHQRVGLVVDAASAVFLRDREAEEAELLHLLDDFLGIGVVVLQLVLHRHDLLLHEGAHHADDLSLLCAQVFRDHRVLHEMPGEFISGGTLARNYFL
jgi:hypothetical protein